VVIESSLARTPIRAAQEVALDDFAQVQNGTATGRRQAPRRTSAEDLVIALGKTRNITSCEGVGPAGILPSSRMGISDPGWEGRGWASAKE